MRYIRSDIVESFRETTAQGKNGLMSDGTWPPFSAQGSRYHLSKVRTIDLGGRQSGEQGKEHRRQPTAP